MRWLDDAACRAVGDWLFFPPVEGPDSAPLRAREARKVCASCPVWRQCRFVSIGETDGIWSGTSAPERQRLRVHLGLTKAGENIGHQPSTDLSGLERFVRKSRARLARARDDVDEVLRKHHPDWFKLPFFHVYEVRDGLTEFNIGA